eukprot:352326-Chlamydomonas_euryale.AAC.2
MGDSSWTIPHCSPDCQLDEREVGRQTPAVHDNAWDPVPLSRGIVGHDQAVAWQLATPPPCRAASWAMTKLLRGSLQHHLPSRGIVGHDQAVAWQLATPPP